MIPLTVLAVSLYQAYPSREWLSWGRNPPQYPRMTPAQMTAQVIHTQLRRAAARAAAA